MRLRTVPSMAVSDAMRTVLSSSLKDDEKLRDILELLDSAGVLAATEPKPLPEVNRAEVRLVCWIAVGRGAPDTLKS